MNFLIIFLFDAIKSLVQWLLSRGINKFTNLFAYTAVTLGLFTALLAAFYALINAVKVVAPYQMSFILSLLPVSVSVYINAYATALILKRVYDYKQSIVAKVTYGGSSDHLM